MPCKKLQLLLYEEYKDVKVPMFSFKRLLGADPTLGVEMASTGEVACYGSNKEEAFLKALLSTDAKFEMKNKSVLVSIQDKLQKDFLPSARKLESELGYTLYATNKTAKYLNEEGIRCIEVGYPGDGNSVGKDDIELMIRNRHLIMLDVCHHLFFLIQHRTYLYDNLCISFFLYRLEIDRLDNSNSLCH